MTEPAASPAADDGTLRPRADRVLARLQDRIGELTSALIQTEDVVEQLVQRLTATENDLARERERAAGGGG